MGRVKVTDPHSGATVTVADDSPQAKAWGESPRVRESEPIKAEAQQKRGRPRKSE